MSPSVPVVMLCLGAAFGGAPVAGTGFDEALATARLQDEVRQERTFVQNHCRGLCSLYIRAGRFEDARQWVQRLIDAGEETEVNLMCLGWLCLKTEKAEAGLQLFLAHCRKGGARPWLLRATAALAESAGRPRLVREWAARSLGIVSASDAEPAATPWLVVAGRLDMRRAALSFVLDRVHEERSTGLDEHSLEHKSTLAARFRADADRQLRPGVYFQPLSAFVLRAMARTLIGDDAGSQEDYEKAFPLNRRSELDGNSLLRALEYALPTPWFLDGARQIAASSGSQRRFPFPEVCRQNARRWLKYYEAPNMLLKKKRILDDDELCSRIAAFSPVRRVVPDPFRLGRRWVATQRNFVFVDEVDAWQIVWWPDLCQGPDSSALDARAIACSRDAVWVGTDRGLFQWERGGRQWVQLVLPAGTAPDTPVQDVRTEAGRLVVALEKGKQKGRWSLALPERKWTRLRKKP